MMKGYERYTQTDRQTDTYRQDILTDKVERYTNRWYDGWTNRKIHTQTNYTDR